MVITRELGRSSACISGVTHYELSRTSAPGAGIMCKGFSSLSLQSIQSLNFKLILISGRKWGGQAGFAGSSQAEGSNRKRFFPSHQGEKFCAMALPLQGSQAWTLSQSYTSAEWSKHPAKCTEKSHPCTLANLPGGHNLYLKRAGKEKGSCTALHHKYEHSRALQPLSPQSPCALGMISSSSNSRYASWRRIQKYESTH